MKEHGSSIVDTLLVATEKCVNAGKCDIVHQTNRERVPQHRNTSSVRTVQPVYSPLC